MYPARRTDAGQDVIFGKVGAASRHLKSFAPQKRPMPGWSGSIVSAERRPACTGRLAFVLAESGDFLRHPCLTGGRIENAPRNQRHNDECGEKSKRNFEKRKRNQKRHGAGEACEFAAPEALRKADPQQEADRDRQNHHVVEKKIRREQQRSCRERRCL